MGFAFVDDTDLVILGKPSGTDDEILQRLQDAITCWNGLLQTSGGALQHDKCYWYFFSFYWINGVAFLKDNPPGKLYLDPNNSTDEPLTYMTPSTPTEAVGVWQDGDGKSNKQFWSLIEKGTEVTYRVRSTSTT